MTESTTFTKEIFEIPAITIDGLKPFQERTVSRTMAFKRGINACDRGLGKSPMALAFIESLNVYPAIIACTAATKLQWAGEIAFWLKGKRSVSICEGKKDFDGQGLVETITPDDRIIRVPVNDLTVDIVVVNYNIIWEWAIRLARRNNFVLIMDEAHKLKDEKTYQHRACDYLASKVESRGYSQHLLALTGTMIVNEAADLKGILKIIRRLHEFGGPHGFDKEFRQYERKRIVYKDGSERWAGSYFGSKNEKLLNQRLKICCVRVTKKEALPDLPPKEIISVPIELSNKAEFRRAKEDFIAYVRAAALADEEFNERLGEMDHLTLCAKSPPSMVANIRRLDVGEQMARMRIWLRQQHANSEARKAQRAPALTQMTVLRELTALGKLERGVEYVKDFLEDNPEDKAILFYHHREVGAALYKALPNSAVVSGGMDATRKDKNKRRFQKDVSCRTIIVSMEAGGEGLNLTAAYNEFFFELPWTGKTFEQCIDRAYGRMIDPHGVIVKLFLSPMSLDKRLLEIINRKIQMASLIQDGVEAEIIRMQDVREELLDALLQEVA